MAISTFGELKTAFDTYQFSNRLTTSYTNAVLLFESVVNRGIPCVDGSGRRYVCFPRNMEVSTNLTTSSGSVALPSDYIAWRAVLYNEITPNVELDYVHPAYFNSTWLRLDTGNPKVFTIEAGNLKIKPADDSTNVTELHYYQKLTTITSGDSATNWLLTSHPDAYLFGGLTELFALARNREAAELYKARRDEVFSDLAMSSARTTGATSPLVREAEYF